MFLLNQALDAGVFGSFLRLGGLEFPAKQEAIFWAV
jgi:hypothetical protein